MPRHAFTLSAVLLLAAMGGASAGQFDDGLAAYKKGDWGLAVQLLLPIAQKDTAQSVDAQVRVGRLAELGRGMTKNLPEAVKWYQKAADQGNVEAEAYLGRMYRTGAGVPRDPLKAAKWSIKAATQSNPVAEANLGYMALDGLVGPPNPADAARWFKKAADHGDGGAMLGLAMLYEAGKGVPKDNAQAYRWYSLAAVHRDDDDPDMVAHAAQLKAALAGKMAPAQVAQAEKLVQGTPSTAKQ